MYYYTDENGQWQSMDGSQAIFEHAMGHKLEFASPRYTDVIAMNPDGLRLAAAGRRGRVGEVAGPLHRA